MRDRSPECRSFMSLSKSLAVLLSISVLLLSGCSQQPTKPAATDTDYQSSESQQLQAIQQQLDAGEFDNAKTLLQQVRNQNLTASEKSEWLLLATQLALFEENATAAASYLTSFEQLNTASSEQKVTSLLLYAQLAEYERRYLEAAQIRDQVLPSLTDLEYEENKDALWKDLLQLELTELDAQIKQFSGSSFASWLELASISRSFHLTLDEQIKAVNDWTILNPLHPAAIELPGTLSGLAELAANRPEKIAILLPLSGRLQQSGEAIRDGFVAAYYESLQKGFEVPEILVLDREQTDSVDQAYSIALEQGSEWLVGPLNKSDVQTLQDRDLLPLPTLALNYGERSLNEAQTPPFNLYQFGLAAEDEARQIAEKAWLDGRKRALVMVPQGAWGERVFEAFRDHWFELGGEIEEVRFYPRLNDYNPEISALLNIDDSKKRHRTIEQLVRLDLDFEPRRRQDADWLFMLALPAQARMIKPALAFNFASDIPVYATSHVFSGSIDKVKDRDLNGIQFCDAPWLLKESELKNDVNRALTNGEGNYSRLYAMGVDAFKLVTRVKQLEAFPDSRIYGATGVMTLDQQRRILRQTECTQFNGGTPVQLATGE